MESFFQDLFSNLVYEKNPQRYADLIKEKLLDLLVQAFPNPMSS